jgi:hypothetical protein
MGTEQNYEPGNIGKFFDWGPKKSESFSAPIYGTSEWKYAPRLDTRPLVEKGHNWGIGLSGRLMLGVKANIKAGWNYKY